MVFFSFGNFLLSNMIFILDYFVFIVDFAFDAMTNNHPVSQASVGATAAAVHQVEEVPATTVQASPIGAILKNSFSKKIFILIFR